MLDLIVFVPPGMSLALMATWSAHSFAPDRFTWRRGLFAALVGGAGVSPLIAALVAFAATWDPASFQFVFNVGGLGGAGEWARHRSRKLGARSPASAMAHVRALAATPALEFPDVRRGLRPTPALHPQRYTGR